MRCWRSYRYEYTFNQYSSQGDFTETLSFKNLSDFKLSSPVQPGHTSALLLAAFGAHFEQSPTIALEHGVVLHMADAAAHEGGGGKGFAAVDAVELLPSRVEGDRFVAVGIERQARFGFQGAFGAAVGAQAALDAGAFLKQQRAIGGAPQRAGRAESGAGPMPFN